MCSLDRQKEKKQHQSIYIYYPNINVFLLHASFPAKHFSRTLSYLTEVICMEFCCTCLFRIRICFQSYYIKLFSNNRMLINNGVY